MNSPRISRPTRERGPDPRTSVSLHPGDDIQAAINANPADTEFRFAAGTWRHQQFLAQAGNRFIGDPGGGTILSGAMILDQFAQQPEPGYWRQSGLPPPLTDTQPAFDPLRANNLNELFVDDVLQTRVADWSELGEGKWWFDPEDNSVVLNYDPAGKLVEYSVTQNQTWNNGQSAGVTWENITVEKYCTSAQQGAHHGVNWHYKNATFRQMHGTGLMLGADGSAIGCKILDNGQCGLAGYQSHNARIEGCEIAGNGWVGYNTDWDGGGLKCCTTDNFQMVGNHVHHNMDQGLWLDIDCTNCLYEDNLCEDNRGAGIMYEISYGGTRIVNNRCLRNGGAGGYGAGGIYVSNSRGVEVAGNHIEVRPGNHGIGGGIAIMNDARGSGAQGTYESRDVDVHDNTIVHGNDTAQNGYWVYQAIDAPNVRFDRNTYYVPDPGSLYWRLIDHECGFDELRAAGHEQNGTLNVGLPGEKPPEPPISGEPVFLDWPTMYAPGHTLTLCLNEDPYEGDALAQIALDGVDQFPTPIPINALRGSNQQARLTFVCQWNSRPQVTVTFPNDLYNDGGDRNLWFVSASYDGEPVGPKEQNVSGSLSF
jgi:parallel beta-helix repeat protein